MESYCSKLSIFCLLRFLQQQLYSICLPQETSMFCIIFWCKCLSNWTGAFKAAHLYLRSPLSRRKSDPCLTLERLKIQLLLLGKTENLVTFYQIPCNFGRPNSTSPTFGSAPPSPLVSDKHTCTFFLPIPRASFLHRKEACCVSVFLTVPFLILSASNGVVFPSEKNQFWHLGWMITEMMSFRTAGTETGEVTSTV